MVVVGIVMYALIAIVVEAVLHDVLERGTVFSILMATFWPLFLSFVGFIILVGDLRG